MKQLPVYVPLIFTLTVVLATWLFAKATRYNRSFVVLILLWIGLQSGLALLGFYEVVNPIPPRFPLLVVPPALAIIALFFTTKGRAFLDGLDMRTLTLFHVIRVPVELVLYWLFMAKAVPELMTFAGQNFDIISGLSAPIVYYVGFANNRINRPLLLGWNLVCLALVITIAVIGLLSGPTPFQQFAFEQPNIAISYFPFNLLPACLVPLVMLAHLATIRQLTVGKTALPVSR